jgi:hypothetical protein
MAEKSIKNLMVYKKSQNNNLGKFASSRKMNLLMAVLINRFEKHVLSNKMHALKWMDYDGHIHIAFQVLTSQPIEGIKHINCNLKASSCSLIFTQDAIFNISIKILYTIPIDSKTRNTEKNLGTYNINELDEIIIIQKFEQFINGIVA